MTLEDKVTSLIAICRENADSYGRAAEIFIGEPDVSHFFEEIAENRLLAANTLESKLLEAGKRLTPRILTAPPSEGWTQPTGHETNARSVIEACYEAQERAINAFDEASETLPEDWRWTLNEYSQHMRSALSKMHTWLDGKERDEKRPRSGARAAANRIKSPER